MSLGRTQGVGLSGVNGFVVEVEAHVAGGLPGFVISGLGDSAVKQAQSGSRRCPRWSTACSSTSAA